MSYARGERYQHKKSKGTYKILCVAIDQASKDVKVVYQSEQDTKIWVRPMSEFSDGRFEQIKEDPHLYKRIVESGCGTCTYDEASGELETHCNACCRRIIKEIWGHTHR